MNVTRRVRVLLLGLEGLGTAHIRVVPVVGVGVITTSVTTIVILIVGLIATPSLTSHATVVGHIGTRLSMNRMVRVASRVPLGGHSRSRSNRRHRGRTGRRSVTKLKLTSLPGLGRRSSTRQGLGSR